MNLDITYKKTFDCIKIYFNGIVHLCILQKKVIGYQTWVDENYYCLEITFESNSILVEYDTEEK